MIFIHFSMIACVRLMRAFFGGVRELMFFIIGIFGIGYFFSSVTLNVGIFWFSIVLLSIRMCASIIIAVSTSTLFYSSQ